MNHKSKNTGNATSQGRQVSAGYGFIELDRSFHELSYSLRSEDGFDLSEAAHVRGNIRWSDIIKDHRTVILSEAGSGKTEEIRHAAEKLREKGQPAFFLRLEHVSDDFEEAFEVGSIQEFDAWLRSDDEGWIFLDSVDEARLKSPTDFARAVRKMSGKIKTAMQRAHIVITGRTHAWRPKSDAQLCQAQFPYGAQVNVVAALPRADSNGEEDAVKTETNEADEPAFKIVALNDLNREQIEKFAIARGLSDPKALLDGLERADAWSFAGRPQDLQEVIGFWRERGRIGTRLEIMKSSIDRRLVERTQDRLDTHSLPIDRAREGARLAAAATTLTHNATIQVPDGRENPTGLPLEEVLSDWTMQDRATLLSYPVFDEAIYGTVRFHHRSVREYFTAEWLAELLASSVSRREVESLLFRNQFGMDVIIPTMRPVLPWLALIDDKVRERLRKIAPEVLFEGGDPSSLPLSVRRELLFEVCEQIEAEVSGLGATSYSAVQRFANHDISNDIRALLEKYAANDELRGFLVRMIWLGRLKELLPEAIQIAKSLDNSKYTRIAAFRAVAQLGDARIAQDLRTHFLHESDELDREWLAELVSETEPAPQNCEWLLTALGKTKTKAKHSVDHLPQVVEEFIRDIDLEAVPGLLRGIYELVNQEPYVERMFDRVSRKNGWLLDAAAVGVERLIEAKHAFAFDRVALDLLFSFRVKKGYRSEPRDYVQRFNRYFIAWPELNRAAFWHDVDASRQRFMGHSGERVTYYGQASIFGSFWSFDSQDFNYVCEQIREQTELDNKLVALSLAFDLYVKGDRRSNWRKKLKDAVSDTTELDDRLKMLLRPPTRTDDARKQEKKWKRQSAERQRRKQKDFERSKEFLLSHVDEIRNPEVDDPSVVTRAQWYLHERLREKSNNLTQWTGGNWTDLVQEYGADVARAYRDGVVAYWRKYQPILRSEGAPPNQTPSAVIFGLTGIGVEAAETPDWPAILSEGEAALATRFACHELNGFPSWFPRLFEKWPKTASKVLMGEIEYELTVETEEQETHYVLSDVCWSGQWAWSELGPGIYRLLETSNPRNSGTLSNLLKIVEGSNVSDEKLAALAAHKIAEQTSRHLPIWFATWVGVEPEKAIPVLAIHLEALSDSEQQTRQAMEFVTRLFGSRRSEAVVARPAFQTAEHLKALYLLMHKYIRRSEDIERAGTGVFSPGLRDDAQEARNKLFDALHRLRGKPAFLAMKDIAENYPEGTSVGWLVRLTRQKAEQEADIIPWTPKDVRDFNDKLDRTPRTHIELADVAVLRLLDLKDDLENGDSSVAGIVRRVEKETEMRNYIAHELNEKSFARYHVPQEDELADAKRPDLRFLGNGFDGAVPAELKLADAKWSGAELFERLENQLAGDYLRDIHSGRGIFILVTRGGKKSWVHPETQKAMNFDELIAALTEHWKKISPRFSNVIDITVIGIDLEKRFARPIV